MTSKITKLIDPFTGLSRVEVYDGDNSSNKYSYFSEEVPDIILNNTSYFNMSLEDETNNKICHNFPGNYM